MSETKRDKEPTVHAHPEPEAAADGSPGLPDLMAAPDAAARPSPAKPAARAAGKSAPDLEAEAMLAAEAAIAAGEQALSQARGLHAAPEQPVRNRAREFVLGALLAVNVLAMFVVALLPAPGSGAKPAHDSEPPAAQPTVPPPVEPRFSEPWNRALAAAERRDFREAVSILDAYLSPRMAPSQQLSVLMALAHYSARNNDFKKAQEYQRRADAIEHSHSLPDDLVAMAKAAAESGDQESLRRIWARFLLQQRQIPSWLYKHVAEAYLQLGDSYRNQANAAEEQARLEQLQQAAARLREQDKGAEGRK
ncbi:MAG TPA: hypothetical protein VFZ65_09150 [Planctomycetota bacterium]|nr:hypothetical protein [Planctomycetota bacterium]